VFLGSGCGGAARYGLNLLFASHSDRFPWSTFFANVVASIFIGMLFGLFQERHWLTPQHYLLLATGFCGGLSTFSAFALENNLFGSQQQYGTALLYILASLMACFVATAVGKWLGV
jgi:fluoride exporter